MIRFNGRYNAEFRDIKGQYGEIGKRTRLPSTAPILKMPQNQAKARPFWPSLGYEIMMVPCAVHNRPAQIPRKAPAKRLKPGTYLWTDTSKLTA
jgi:hypothetical protein